MKTTWEKIRTPESVAEDQWYYEQCVDDGYLLVVTGPDPAGAHHMTITHSAAENVSSRWPLWEEILDARHRFCPSHVVMAVVMPGVFVDLYDSTIQLHEVVKLL